MGAYVHQAYPSHRFHPSLGENEYLQVETEEQDDILTESDELWRDSPYSDEERAEWKEKNPKAKKAGMPKPKAAEGAEGADDAAGASTRTTRKRSAR